MVRDPLGAFSMQPWQRPSAFIISDFAVILVKVNAEGKCQGLNTAAGK
jgi:hypothetical protein